MTREEAIKILLQHSEHWKRLLTENICSKEEGLQTVEALDMAIKALEQETSDDAVSRGVFEQVMWERDVAIDQLKELGYGFGEKPRTGHWIFDEILYKHYYCSECKSMGVDYWDYCPNCGCRMVEPQESEEISREEIAALLARESEE